MLSASRTASLATVGRDGSAHAANVWFATDDQLHLYWVSAATARHSIDLTRRSAIAATVYAEVDRPEHIHGLQLRGHTNPIAPDTEAWRYAFSLYARRYEFVESDPMYRKAVEAQTFYRLAPRWMRLVDNRRGFGWKAEQTFNE